jgi:hypothetical protein
MNAKRMLIAGIMALEMAAPLASFAATAPRPAPDSETTASDASALVAQPRDGRERRRRAHRQGADRARRVKDRGGSGMDVALAYRDAVFGNLGRVDVDVKVITQVNQVIIAAAAGANASQVFNIIQANQL